MKKAARNKKQGPLVIHVCKRASAYQNVFLRSKANVMCGPGDNRPEKIASLFFLAF